MKRITILFILLFSTNNALADVILSLALKQSTKIKESVTSTATIKNEKSSTYNITTSAQPIEERALDLGIMMQTSFSKKYFLGLGYFQDNTGILTFGVKFK